MTTALIDSVNGSFKNIIENAANPSAKEQMEALNKILVENGFLMKGKPFPTFLKPYFLSNEAKALFAKATKHVMSAAEKCAGIYFEKPEMRKYFEVDDIEEPYVDIQPNYPRRLIQARLDAFYYPESNELKFLEFNCDSPSGMGWHDRLVGFIANQPAYKNLEGKYEIKMEILLDRFHDMLMKKLRESGCEEKKPTVAIVCDRDSTIRNDVNCIIDYFNEKYDHKTIFADPRDGVIKDGEFFMNGERVHLVYRDAIQEFTAAPEETNDTLEAFKQGLICFINPFCSRVGGLKCVLWFLTDERAQHRFTDEEKQAIIDHVPWTRFMHDEETTFRGEKVSLFPFVKENRDKFVLKPNAGFGGFGVTIGCEVSDGEWASVLEDCKSNSWVVQEYVPLPKDDYPQFTPELEWKTKNVNVNFFSFDGEFGGGFVRVADSSIINVHQGGGLIPMCFVEKEK